MAKVKSYKELFGGNLKLTLSNGAKILSDYPNSKKALLHIVKNLKASDKKREIMLKHGIEVPPLVIISTTRECNLACKGCYSCEFKKSDRESEIKDERKAEILNEASGLGVSIVMLAGGEPLLSTSWLNCLAAHDELFGIVFTNGTLFDDNRISWFNANRHIIPALSIEGGLTETDNRRGAGVYATAVKTMEKLKSAGIPFGVSITVTSANLPVVCSPEFIKAHIENGCRLFIFVEYVPVEKGTEPLVLSATDKKKLQIFCLSMSEINPALFIPFPGDEEPFGGCLAAGRGFIHISSSGELEPCPFAPFSDTNLANMSFKDALSSTLLQKIRDNHHLLKEGEGGCALWSNRDWLQKL